MVLTSVKERRNVLYIIRKEEICLITEYTSSVQYYVTDHVRQNNTVKVANRARYPACGASLTPMIMVFLA